MNLHKVLSSPRVYQSFERLLIGDYRRMVDLLEVAPGSRVLDLGCGPAPMLAYLPDVDYLGVDISAKYIEAAKARYGARGRFVCRDLAQVAADEPHAFDAVLLLGVLHHLDDATALHALEVARDALKPGGRMVAIDATVFGGQSRIAKVLAKMDRGRHVRSPDGYVELARRVFPTVDSFMTHDLLRIPYTHHFLVCAPKRDVRSAA